MTGPLQGLTVIEMAGIGPCPLAGQLLADQGAEVIVVDRAPGGARPHDINNRNKRSIAVNLKAPGATDLVLDLASQADVLIEGFRPGVMERLGLGPDVCLAQHPDLVYGRMTGWGQEGPMARMAGHDLNYVAQTGLLHMMGDSDRPPAPPLNLVADYGGGTMFLLFGIFAALWERSRSGQGQVVDAAMIDGVNALGAVFAGMTAQGMWGPARGANMLDGGAPYYRVYETSDGGHVSIAAIEPQFFTELVKKAGIPAELAARRDDHSTWPEQRAAYAQIFAARTRADWAAIFEGSDACLVPVLTPDEAVAHPHAIARDAYVTIAGLPQAAPAPRFSRSQPGTPCAPVPAGSNTAGVLTRFGIAPDRQEQLRKAGAIH
ncbi:CaiB/BaiF CoA transferase family protein [Antarcticimicrobium sediminis]|uniref:CoA transferase n=1 Tax=Antarcticimicrobium sediminis TaxID=2546227 RepID=A0A4R5EM60_9RHOB|nr:CaiB/BaiF CoA-transferase family protein [Antarcticimicrobium sediminis]TDE35654.1 CoA transferase [Antarcticimicrobium sediminis]